MVDVKEYVNHMNKYRSDSINYKCEECGHINTLVNTYYLKYENSYCTTCGAKLKIKLKTGKFKKDKITKFKGFH